ncbi:hypothetical protein [Caulobacter segnis]|uniref:hypothetical protein n=1 Tax=Caulobacter segnis TaxID=88688 RepID=UPI002691AEF7|nr:hypothetical protein [Caulobacter segnis]
MRYRPLGNSGPALSALTLRLGDATRPSADDTRALLLAAAACGITSVQIDGASDDLLRGAREAFARIERRQLFVTLRARGAPEAMLASTLDALGLEAADLLLINDPQGPAPPAALENALRARRAAGQGCGLGVAARGEIDPRLLDHDLVVAIVSPFDLTSGLAERQRLREADRRGLLVFGEDFWPQTLRDGARTLPRPSLWRRRTDPLAGIGGYDFLSDTPGWTSEEICLAYALTEPTLTSVCVSAEHPDDLRRLVAVVDRALPDSVRAQIELARFSAQERDKAAGRA